jgi:hypothetical protein
MMHQLAKTMWESDSIRPLSADSLSRLIDNRIPAVRVTHFAEHDEIRSLREALLVNAGRTHSIPQVARLGISQYEQGLRCSKAEYFATAKSLEPQFADIYAQSFSPVRRLIGKLRDTGFDADVMSEPGMGRYFVGNGKLRNGFSPIHVDFAPQDSTGWAIADAKAQLACNLYLQVPDEGGALLLWDRLWQPEDDIHQVGDNYFYSEQVVQGNRKLRIAVSEGELLIINSRNYHAVEEARDRLAYGAFISVFPDHRLRLWS